MRSAPLDAKSALPISGPDCVLTGSVVQVAVTTTSGRRSHCLGSCRVLESACRRSTMATTENDDRLLLRLPEVEARLGLGRGAVYELVQRGDLPVVRVGRVVRAPVGALQYWVERQAEDHGRR